MSRNERQESQDYSHFQLFLHKALNMLNIWEMIMSCLSATDVANCLKVNKGMRSAFGQCINLNSRLRQKLDLAATVRAIERRKLKSTAKLQLECIKYRTKGKCVVPFDGVLFYRQDGPLYKDTFECSPKGDIVFYKAFSKTGSYCQSVVFPTTNPKRFFISDLDNVDFAEMTLIEIEPGSVRTIDTSSKYYPSAQEGCFENPYCIQYRLFFNYRKVYMDLLNERAEPERTVLLLDLKHDGNYISGGLSHVACIEEVILLSYTQNGIHVHDNT